MTSAAVLRDMEELTGSDGCGWGTHDEVLEILRLALRK
jgi:hypothetical protein